MSNIRKISLSSFHALVQVFLETSDTNMSSINVIGEDLCEYLYSIEEEWNTTCFIDKVAENSRICFSWERFNFKCDKSITVDEFNFLLFEGDFNFLIVQRDHTIEAVIIPRLQYFYFGSTFYGPEKCLQKLNSFIEAECEIVNKYLKRSKMNFGGILLDHPGPYHYFAIKLFSLYSIVCGGIKSKPRLISRYGRDYFNLGNLFSDVFEYSSVGYSNRVFLKNSLDYSSFFICFGLRRLARDFIKEREFDRFVYEKSLISNLPQKYLGVDNDEIFNSPLLIWLGITSSKRAWVEEEDALCKLVEILSYNYAKLTVFVDGITNSVNSRDVSPSRAGDCEKVERMIDRFPTNAIGVSIVGMTPEEKINIASRVGFFIGNHATGSIWVSRVCRVPGVVHLSCAAIKSSTEMHFQPRAETVPKELVFDVMRKEDAPSAFHVSYSINADEFIDFTLKVMKKNNIL